MDTVKIDRKKLTDIIKKNRDAHVEIVEEAKVEYRKQCIEAMRENLETAQNGGDIELHISLIAPQDYSDEYNTVLHMLDLMVASQQAVELTHEAFRNYVEDEWQWSQQWKMSNVHYSSKVRL